MSILNPAKINPNHPPIQLLLLAHFRFQQVWVSWSNIPQGKKATINRRHLICNPCSLHQYTSITLTTIEKSHESMMAMKSDITQVLRMKEGTDENSYAKVSFMGMKILLRTKAIREKVIREFYCSEQSTTTICMADLGCSSAELNTLSVLSDLIQVVDKARLEHGQGPIDYQICLNDLPGNDFNTLFRSVTKFENKLKQQLGDDFGHCFVNGVPGSFYGRLFPTNSLHFVHSSTCLHWLSQVPERIEDNKRNIYMAKTSPPSVLKAYYEQFQKDFLAFLHCRSKEVVANGKMVLTLLGRQDNDPCYSKDCGYMWDLLARVLNDMVSEGYIEEEKLNTFDIPIYTPSPSELEFIVEKEGSFALNEVHVFQVSWEANAQDNGNASKIDFAICMRSVIESLISSHFGDAIIEEVFQRYKDIIGVAMAKENVVVANIIVTLTRKGHD